MQICSQIVHCNYLMSFCAHKIWNSFFPFMMMVNPRIIIKMSINSFLSPFFQFMGNFFGSNFILFILNYFYRCAFSDRYRKFWYRIFFSFLLPLNTFKILTVKNIASFGLQNSDLRFKCFFWKPSDPFVWESKSNANSKTKT